VLLLLGIEPADFYVVVVVVAMAMIAGFGVSPCDALSDLAWPLRIGSSVGDARLSGVSAVILCGVGYERATGCKEVAERG
jgi:hypothetical protein